MDRTSKASQSAHRSASDAAEEVGGANGAASDASAEIAKDLRALREDFGRLAQQLSDIFSSKGNAAWRRAKSSVDEIVSEAEDKGRETAEGVREVSDNFAEAIDESIKNRPYTTLAMALALGFLLGAVWRR